MNTCVCRQCKPRDRYTHDDGGDPRVNEAEAAIVRNIFDMYLQHGIPGHQAEGQRTGSMNEVPIHRESPRNHPKGDISCCAS